MEPPLPWAAPAVLPIADMHLHGLVIDYGDMQDIVVGLLLPIKAPMAVLSALETARELVRHSYYRYKFATTGVRHSLVALDLVRDGRAANLPAALAARIDQVRLLRDKVTQGVATSAAAHGFSPARRAGLHLAPLLIGHQ
jgi:hypothetical protein